MPQELPYLPTYKNVGVLFEKIRAAKVPESFTQKYLNETLGLKSSGDRSLITLLKSLGFIDNSGRPTPRYAALKNEKVAGIEIARGVREAYEGLFSANENAHKLEGQELKGLVAQVAGSDSGTTSKIVGTFKALLAVSDFESDSLLKEEGGETTAEKEKKIDKEKQADEVSRGGMSFQGMRPEFHYNIQIHLPSNGSEETYMNIFNAVRKVFK
ncbi:MAG: hypothetical protein C4528_03675 [Gammaproteobacteria bacterium]|nr:MAG: hypothetical protein C4528_03675 [Gammaproteobacteria bacterium]